MKELISEKKFKLKLHQFYIDHESLKYCFFPIDSTNSDMESSGICRLVDKIVTLDKPRYFTTKLTPKHALLVENLRSLIEKNDNFLNQTNTPEFQQDNGATMNNIKLIKFSFLIENVKDIFETFKNEKEIEKHLVDLHDSGIFVYKKMRRSKNWIITDPRWFNQINHSIVNQARKIMELKLEKLSFSFINNFMKKREIDNLINSIRGNSKNVPLSDIWSLNDLKKLSKVEKQNFTDLLQKYHYFDDVLNPNCKQANIHFTKTDVEQILIDSLQVKKITQKQFDFFSEFFEDFGLILAKNPQFTVPEHKLVYLSPFLFSVEKPKYMDLGESNPYISKFEYTWQIFLELPFENLLLSQLFIVNLRKIFITLTSERNILGNFFFFFSFFFSTFFKT